MCFFQSARRFARLGYTRTTKDGEHQDIPITYQKSHEDFSRKLKIHDISMVYLAHDVKFNGKLKI